MQEEISYAATSSVKGIVSPQLILLAYSTSYLSGIYVIYFPEKNELFDIFLDQQFLVDLLRYNNDYYSCERYFLL